MSASRVADGQAQERAPEQKQEQGQAYPRRFWLISVAGFLALALLAMVYVQWRQFKLLDTASSYRNDALGWSFSQLETEHLRLRNQMQLSVDDPARHAPASVQLRYDIFVSRVGLVDHARAAGIMGDQPAYGPAIAQVRAFIQEADRYLADPPVQAVDAAALARLLPALDALSVPLHDLSLGASHLLYQRATERNNAVRQQSQLSIALTAFQCVLLLVLALIVLRQFAALTERRRSLESLAASLGAARTEAEAASRAKSVFLANMSHEIRTPFHGMLGMMSLLQDSGLTPQQASHLDTARESAHHLLQILNDILDISQLESGKLHVVPQTMDLPQLVAQVEALMHAQALGKGLALQVVVATDVPRWVRADATRLKQILFNLLSNAIKFSNAGTIVLRVAMDPTHGAASGAAPASPGWVVFTIADPGIGMPPALIERLFQRFMQGDGTPARRATGTGLGLEISRDLARLMGGDITVHSEPGAGSTFTLALPLAAVGAPLANEAAVARVAGGPQRPLRVLVAEDHAVNRAYMEAVLDKLGHHAVFSVNGNGAVQAVQAQPPGAEFDIVLMDLHMPGMDGFAAARAIRALAPPRGRVPIVALTADAFHEARDLARASGMDGFLTKPAHLPQLREALARYGGTGLTATPAAGGGGGAEALPPAGHASEAFEPVIVEDLVRSLSAAKYAVLLTTFFDARAQTVSELRQAAADRAHDEISRHAHGLRGAALSLGLRTLAGLAQCEPAAGADADTLGGWVDAIDRHFAITRAECVRCGYLEA
jgi:two-component system, sensor histidine kinase